MTKNAPIRRNSSLKLQIPGSVPRMSRTSSLPFTTNARDKQVLQIPPQLLRNRGSSKLHQKHEEKNILARGKGLRFYGATCGLLRSENVRTATLKLLMRSCETRTTRGHCEASYITTLNHTKSSKSVHNQIFR